MRGEVRRAATFPSRRERRRCSNSPSTPRVQLAHDYIGTEHILLGLIREGKGVAAQVLAARGVDDDMVIPQVMLLLAGGDPEAVRTAPFAHERSSPSVPTWLQPRADGNTCSFCGRRLLDAGMIVTGYGGAICDSCIRRASQVVTAAKKQTGRGSFTIPPLVVGREPAEAPPLPSLRRFTLRSCRMLP